MGTNKLAMLNNVLSHFERMRRNDSLHQIVFEEYSGSRHGIGNSVAKNVILDAAIKELKRQIEQEAEAVKAGF